MDPLYHNCLTQFHWQSPYNPIHWPQWDIPPILPQIFSSCQTPIHSLGCSCWTRRCTAAACCPSRCFPCGCTASSCRRMGGSLCTSPWYPPLANPCSPQSSGEKISIKGVSWDSLLCDWKLAGSVSHIMTNAASLSSSEIPLSLNSISCSFKTVQSIYRIFKMS